MVSEYLDELLHDLPERRETVVSTHYAPTRQLIIASRWNMAINEMVRRVVRLGSLHREDHRMHIASIAIDLGKTTFHLVALGERNKVLVRKKFGRQQLLAYTANLPASVLAIQHSGSVLPHRPQAR
ncbi:MAG TPA: hypothetical protein VEH30_16675 [Terriglobales bacterium]|nr:hypothetical protein [Terriglobales bacterium]